MSRRNSKITGKNYTPTVALLLGSLIGIPLMSSVSLPSGNFFFYLSAASSVSMAILAAVTWWRSSELAMPSIAVD